MMQRCCAGICVAAIALLSACNPPDNREADMKSLKDHEAQWSKDLAAKDADKWTNYYTDDASLLLPGAPAINGKEAIRKALKELVSDPNFSLSIVNTRAEVARSGDVGVTQGHYTMTVTNPDTKQSMTEKGKYLTVYRKGADGTWKSSADMVSSDAPPPPPPAK